MRQEKQQGAGVGGHVHDLGLGAGLQEGVAHGRDQRDDKEGAGSRTDQAVVETDHGTDQAGHHVVLVAVVAQQR